ncbi:glycosyltransferase family 69 protein [Glonium stellatum]|uniref:Glycosyltransferase family 69 protein n=1 Tax=Glonium stellatum TaxID=574774 RepID=A0A8E2FCL0_9PEZI|nr:glycosyltransferase family 69 protein [Glonium stellatum]
MFRRKVTVLLQAGCLLLTAFSLIISFGYFGNISSSDVIRAVSFAHKWPFSSSHAPADTTKGNPTLFEIAPPYIKAILSPEDDYFPRLKCPKPNLSRYNYLQPNSTTNTGLPKYYFALDLHDCAHVLPRLLGSVVEAIRFLGPQNCVLSVVEGRSVDGTFEILKLLQKEIEYMGAKSFLTTNEVHPWGEDVNRVEALAELRNQALWPLRDYSYQFSPETTVVFINDVALCFEDILELIHQRVYQGADMTCAMDWTYVSSSPTFYDVWIARGMNGDSFFDIPEDGSWDSSWNLLWNNPEAKKRLDAGRPFQVFSCWNGATAFTAKPILERKIKFRSSYEDECFSGEPQLFCKDMWHIGYGKIAVVPSVNVEYGDEAAQKIKWLKGYASRWVAAERRYNAPLKIEWEESPPTQTRCLGDFINQHWVPWDEQLAEHDFSHH